MNAPVMIIGGGLAGVEAARRLARRGVEAELFEMRPHSTTPAHRTGLLAELVCSNSFRSDAPGSAVGLLKEEMRRLGSLVMEAAEETRVPAGKALAVDRDEFGRLITGRVESLPGVRLVREEVRDLDPARITVLATGPLTSESMSRRLAELVGDEHLYFYDAVSPIVTAESIDMDRAFSASRYDEESPGDYLNCPMSEEEYTAFYQALVSADRMPPREFEEARFFEGCLPVEAMADRGPQTLAFGPMKPVGLNDPRTGRRPYAVVQLRRENRAGTLYNLVGFQTRLKQGEQKRILAMIPGLENARIVRYGCMHRNTFINAPRHINQYLQFDEAPGILAAGQVSGVEGYVESAAMGILAGENAARLALGRPPVTPPPTTALGGLVGRLTDRTTRNFQPSNVNFGMLPPAPKKIGKKNRPAFYTERALADLEKWLGEVDGD